MILLLMFSEFKSQADVTGKFNFYYKGEFVSIYGNRIIELLDGMIQTN